MMTMLYDHYMARRWSIAKAKAQLSRVVAETRNEVQVLENRGVEVAVVLDTASYERLLRLAEQSHPAKRMQAFLALSRAIRAEGGADLDIPRRRPRPSPFSKRRR